MYQHHRSEYTWLQTSRLQSVGSARYNLVWAAQIELNHHRILFLTTTDVFEPSIERKVIQSETWQSDFAIWQPTRKCLNRKSYEQWHIALLSSNSFPIEMHKKRFLDIQGMLFFWCRIQILSEKIMAFDEHYLQ